MNESMANRGTDTGFKEFLESSRAAWPPGQGQPSLVTYAPGRLDCMGGMADYSGVLALQMPIGCGVFVAAGRRTDQQMMVQSLGWNGCENPVPWVEFPLAHFYESEGRLVSYETLAARFESCSWVRLVAGVCLALLKGGRLPNLGGGVTLVMKSDIPSQAGLGASSAIQVAVAKVLAALFNVELSDQQLLAACREADVTLVGTGLGLIGHQTCLLGEAGILLQIQSQPDDVLGTLTLPDHIKFVAVDSGVRLPIYHQRYTDNRVCSLLGKHIIDGLIESSATVGDPTGGSLASIAPNEYIRRFRNDLPVKIRGRDYVSQYGRPAALGNAFVSDRIYKVRSRTEHHIYENDRTHRLLERLARARRAQDTAALVEAGELMYASHWSYGQRCGMGSIETDILVNLIRDAGVAKGLYGAKVTAGGCGGALAVLMADQPQAMAALQAACEAYQSKTGKTAKIIRGSQSGAATFGARKVE